MCGGAKAVGSATTLAAHPATTRDPMQGLADYLLAQANTLERELGDLSTESVVALRQWASEVKAASQDARRASRPFVWMPPSQPRDLGPPAWGWIAFIFLTSFAFFYFA